MLKKISLFQKSNPNVFTPCKITVETWHVIGQQATLISAVDEWNRDRHREPVCRSYPDPELFPGSIMQFVDALPEADSSDEE
jgi:hypothetical protein